MIKLAALNIKKLRNYADWQLLLFLVLFLNVKLGVKVIAIILIYIMQFNFSFGFNLKSSRLPLFYLSVIGIAIFNLFVFGNISNIKYDFVFLSGLAFWLLCILAIHQIKLAVERNDVETLHRTLFAFFLLNVIVSIANFASIIWETKAFNPYLYQGLYQKYFISTGDYIKGITFDVSITNSALCTLGVIYFLFRKNWVMLLLCMAVLLLTGSNALNLITAAMLILLFIVYSNRDQKSIILVCFVFLAVFMVKVSPQNSSYVVHTSQKILHKDTAIKVDAQTNSIPITQIPDCLLNYNERREKVARLYLDSQHLAVSKRVKQIIKPGILPGKKLFIPQPDINAKPYQEAADTTEIQHTLLTFINDHKKELPLSGQNIATSSLPGKAIALLETVSFLWHHPKKIWSGDGIGNFSSKIAFKATNFGLTGTYPVKYVYISKDFMANHLDIYLNFFSKNIGLHSVINNPNAVYYQLLGEYGLIGLIVFFIYYLGYFLKHYRQLSYGIPLLIFVLAIFFLEYWFEQLSVMVLIELMLLLNIKEGKTLNPIPNVR